MPLPRGAHYEPGSNRHMVRLENGQRVTRARAMNMFAESVGARNEYELKQRTRQAKLKGVFDSELHGKRMDRARQRGDYTQAETRALAAMVSTEPRNERGQIINDGPGSPLAHYLTAIGRRSEPGVYGVGETPSTFA
jgi:hypothetical protein